jgi:menaquinone reductase, multiheme cytochrome c subunit
MLLAVGLTLVAAAVILLAMALAPARIVQPIAYNHNLHIEGEGLECVDCHVHVERLASASLPAITICEDCHGGEPMSDSSEELELLRYMDAGHEIPWARVYRVPDHVFFSHRRHVVLGELECSLCHGDVPSMAAPITTAYLPTTMQACMNCHRERKVTNDCLACHR